MRSPIGPFLVVVGLATTVVLVLVLFQTIGLRRDVDLLREEAAALRSVVEARETGVSEEDLIQRLDELEAGIRDWLIATGADGGFDETPAASGDGDAVSDRLEEILERLEALDARIDEICDGVPVC